MSGFVLHPAAVADLEEVWEFIAADNLGAADRVLDEIRLAMQSLASFPQMGHTRADLTTRPLRFYSVRDYLIAYAALEEPPVVVAILHGRRNPRVIAAHLRERE